jgi:DnaJ-domain-containing protein 1
MKHSELINEIVGTYQQHGWRLRRLLLRPETRAEMQAKFASGSLPLDGAQVTEAAVDALWFSRASHEQREAWELRLLAENPFALFETFEKDETEEQREELRREMEARLRDYANK